MCLGPKEVVFEKPEQSSQHQKSLYVRGHIDGKPISRILIDGTAVVNLMSYSIFKKRVRFGILCFFQFVALQSAS
jgi:hypothetical protein